MILNNKFTDGKFIDIHPKMIFHFKKQFTFTIVLLFLAIT